MKHDYRKALVLAGKWAVAGALLFALTLPFTTCQSSRGLQEHRLPIEWSNFWTIFCFAWPVPILVARTFWRKARDSWQVVVLECMLDVFAWLWLTLNLVFAEVFTFGGSRAGSGYELATSSLTGYLVLSGMDLLLLVRVKPRPPVQG